jgi:hypothetical protein
MDKLTLFFDGCHKIYYAERADRHTIDEMREYGYEVITGDFSQNLDELWRKSCSLKFIEPADLDFSRPHVSQFETIELQVFETRLKKYYGGAAAQEAA